MDFPLLHDIVILLGFSVVVVFILQRFRLPSILGFLLTGLIIGPYGFSLIEKLEQIVILSEIGVILLLFVIGMELTVKQLSSIKRTVFYGGILQVGLTIGVTTLIYLSLGFPWKQSVFIGFLGVACILKPVFNCFNIAGIIGLVSGFFLGFCKVVLGKIAKVESIYIIIFIFF